MPNCTECEHLISNIRTDTHPEMEEFFCGHYGVLELDSNEPGEWIGFNTTELPDWCPLKILEDISEFFRNSNNPEQVMYYMILKWVPKHEAISENPESISGRWEVLHYTHDFDDFARMQLKYPENEGGSIVHMINLKYCKSHETLDMMRAYREKLKAQKATST